SSLAIADGLYVTTSRDVLEALASGEGPRSATVALGCAGWGAGQLEQELVENSWLTVPADHELVFEMPLPLRWQAAASRIGVDLSRLTDYSGHAWADHRRDPPRWHRARLRRRRAPDRGRGRQRFRAWRAGAGGRGRACAGAGLAGDRPPAARMAPRRLRGRRPDDPRRRRPADPPRRACLRRRTARALRPSGGAGGRARQFDRGRAALRRRPRRRAQAPPRRR